MRKRELIDQLNEAETEKSYWQEKCHALNGRMAMKEADIADLERKREELEEQLAEARAKLAAAEELTANQGDHINILDRRVQKAEREYSQLVGIFMAAISRTMGGGPEVTEALRTAMQTAEEEEHDRQRACEAAEQV